MSSARRLTSYPDWMLALAGEFEAPTNRRRAVLSFTSNADARRYRQEFMGFRNALEREGLNPQYPNFQSVRFLVRDSTLQLVVADEYLPKPTMSD